MSRKNCRPTRQIYSLAPELSGLYCVVSRAASYFCCQSCIAAPSPSSFQNTGNRSQLDNNDNNSNTKTTMSNYTPDVEKDHAGGDAVNGTKNNTGYDLHHDHHDEDTALRRLRTAGSLTISPELFEKIYLSPKNRVSNNIRSTFGNPTPL
jgi:hypothetical protein